MRIAELPDGIELHFPENTSDEDMDAAVRRYLDSGKGMTPAEVLAAIEKLMEKRPDNNKAHHKELLSTVKDATKAIATSIDGVNDQTGAEKIVRAVTTLIEVVNKGIKSVDELCAYNKEANAIRANAIRLIEARE